MESVGERNMTGTIFGLENIEKRKEKYSLVTHDVVDNVDVCVVGSGAGGAIIRQNSQVRVNLSYYSKRVAIMIQKT